ncbi:MAG TPA: hypothetical protein VGK19_21335 [Capsulimonadaceae bacterium]|jgi:hypothetical protein
MSLISAKSNTVDVEYQAQHEAVLAHIDTLSREELERRFAWPGHSRDATPASVAVAPPQELPGNHVSWVYTVAAALWKSLGRGSRHSG